LVEEFKKTGEFDRLRRELLAQFQRDDLFSGFKDRIEDIARQRLTSDQMLHYLPPDLVHKELRQEVDRFPVVERAVAEVRMLTDPSFLASIQTSVQKILRLEKGGEQAIAKAEDKPCSPVTDLEKTGQDAQVSGPSKPMVTGVSTDSGPSIQSAIGPTSATSLLVTVPSQPSPREDEARDIRNGEFAFESTSISESTPKILNDQANIADVEMKDPNSH
jgi:hypothetical protein